MEKLFQLPVLLQPISKNMELWKAGASLTKIGSSPLQPCLPARSEQLPPAEPLRMPEASLSNGLAQRYYLAT